MARAGRKPDPLEATFARLRAARADPHAPDSLVALREALAARSAHAVQRSAEIARDLELHAVERELAAAFPRFLVEPTRSDKGCVAKTAIAEALFRLGADVPEIFLAGARHVQKEAAWGPPVDTAAGLRGACVMGLVRIGHPEAFELVAEVLADPEAQARIAAAQAVGYGGSELGAPLLRLKALVGDSEPRVLAECFASLLRIAPVASLPFVARFLESPGEEVRELAALALGEAQLPAAFPLLRDFCAQTRPGETLRAGLLALALLRTDEAIAHLLSLVAEAPSRTARQAVGALAIHRERAGFPERIREAARLRADPELSEAVREALDG